MTVLEPGALLGNVAAAVAFGDGYRTAGTLHDDALVDHALAQELGLTEHGLQLRETPRPRWLAGPDGGITLSHDVEATASSIARHNEQDARHWPEFSRFLQRGTGALADLLRRPPPDVLDTKNLRTALQVAKAAVSVRRLGKVDMFELLRAMPMAARDFADDHFASPLLKAGLVGPGLLGTWGGPWSPSSTTSWLLREAALGAGVVGGPAALSKALLAACRQLGVELRAESPVQRVAVEDGAVAGVVLRTGDRLDADVVLSALDPRTTLLELVHPTDLPLRLESQVSKYRSRGIVAAVALALDGPVQWEGLPGGRPEHVQVGADLAALERAFDPVKYGEDTDLPWLDIRVPTVEQPELGNGGAEVLTILATGFSDDALREWRLAKQSMPESDDDREESILDAVLDALELHAPGISAQVVASDVRAPSQLQRDFSLAGGHLWQGESALDQLLSFRPAPSCAAGATAVRGLHLCSGGIHPGGGLRLTNGVLSARQCVASRS